MSTFFLFVVAALSVVAIIMSCVALSSGLTSGKLVFVDKVQTLSNKTFSAVASDFSVINATGTRMFEVNQDIGTRLEHLSVNGSLPGPSIVGTLNVASATLDAFSQDLCGVITITPTAPGAFEARITFGQTYVQTPLAVFLSPVSGEDTAGYTDVHANPSNPQSFLIRGNASAVLAQDWYYLVIGNQG